MNKQTKELQIRISTFFKTLSTTQVASCRQHVSPTDTYQYLCCR